MYITGTLKYYDGSDWSGAGWPEGEEEGNFLVLKAVNVPDDTTVTAELIGGETGHPVTLDSDLNIVFRIADKDTQTVKLVSTKGDWTDTKVFDLSRLTVEEDSEE